MSPLLQRMLPWLFLCVWSSGYAVAKLALEYTEPLNLLAYRYIGASLFVLPIIWYLRLSLPKWSQIKGLMATGLFLHIGHFGTLYVGMKLGASANIMALFAASQPVLIILASAAFIKQWPSWRVWLGLFLGLSGAAWVIGIDMQGQQGYLLGALLGFLAVLGMSVGQVIEKQRKMHIHPLMATGVQYVFAMLVSIPLAWFVEGFAFTPEPTFFLATAHLSIVNTVVGIMLMFAMVRTGSLAQATSIMFLVPAVAALVAWPVAGETVPLSAIPGMILAMAGAIWTRRVSS